MRAIVGGEIYAAQGVIGEGIVLIEDGIVQALGTQAELEVPEGAQILDASGKSVIPGLIDVHTHGLLGDDVMGEGLEAAIKAYPEYGVTSFMATTFTLPQDRTLQSLIAMAEVLRAPPVGSICLGIHIEGPHLSRARPGAATPDLFEPLTMEGFLAFQEACEGNIRMITFAPEEGEAMQLIPGLREAGIVPVIGHSNATFDQVGQAVGLGLNHATHTYNAMRGFHHRDPGVLGGVLYFDAIYAELIGDGVHVHPAAMELLIRLKGLDKVALISDSAPFGGLPPGEYQWEHLTVFIRDGRCELEDGTLAGAHALLDSGIRNLVHSLNLPLADALIPATRTPAASVGLETKGELAVGRDADVVLLDRDLLPAHTIVGGETVWLRTD